jgi:hypothetical protein
VYSGEARSYRKMDIVLHKVWYIVITTCFIKWPVLIIKEFDFEQLDIPLDGILNFIVGDGPSMYSLPLLLTFIDRGFST